MYNTYKPSIANLNWRIVNAIQWAPLNGITDNRINRLLGLNLSRIPSPKLLFHT